MWLIFIEYVAIPLAIFGASLALYELIDDAVHEWRAGRRD